MELQMAFGQMKRTDFSGPEFHNSVMTFLSTAGGKYPVGTTFPNHATLGTTGEQVSFGKNMGLKVTKVDAGSVASSAGIHIGDVVTSIAGKTFKDVGGYFAATERAAALQSYPVEFTRDGKTITVTVPRAFRPAWSEAVVPHADSTLAVTAPGNSVSVADELAKLVQLRKEGILTQAEFETQKEKVLRR